MAISTTTDLEAAVADWLNRSDLSGRIPDFVSLAVEEMGRKVNTPLFDAVTDYTVVSLDVNNGYFTDPVNNRAIISVMDEDGHKLEAVTFDAYNATASQGLSQGHTYAVVGTRIYVTPAMAVDDVFTIHFKTSDPTDFQNYQGSAGTLSHPEVLLSGSLMHAYIYLKDDARANTFQQRFYQAMEDVNAKGSKQGAGRARIQDESIQLYGAP